MSHEKNQFWKCHANIFPIIIDNNFIIEIVFFGKIWACDSI